MRDQFAQRDFHYYSNVKLLEVLSSQTSPNLLAMAEDELEHRHLDASELSEAKQALQVRMKRKQDRTASKGLGALIAGFVFPVIL